MKKLINFIIFNYKLCILSIQSRINTLKTLFIHDYPYFVVFAQILIIFIVLVYYKIWKENNYGISFKLKIEYKNLKGIPDWLREILKDKRVFNVYQVLQYIYTVLKYYKCICELKLIILISNHYSLAIFIKYILFTIFLVLCSYLLTKIVSYCYYKFNGEVILYKYLNVLDFNFAKLKSWYSKIKGKF